MNNEIKHFVARHTPLLAIHHTTYYLFLLPIDLILPSPATDHKLATHLTYVDKWKEQMRQAYETTNRQSMQSKSKDVERRNAKRLRASILLPRDRVLV